MGEKMAVNQGSHGAHYSYKTVVLIVLVLFVVAVVMIESETAPWFDSDRGSLVTHYRSAEMEKQQNKSSKLELVGWYKKHVEYGILKRRRTGRAGGETSIMVFCQGGKYFTIGGSPDELLRRILEEGKYPGLPREQFNLKEIPATTDDEALKEAKEELNSFSG